MIDKKHIKEVINDYDVKNMCTLNKAFILKRIHFTSFETRTGVFRATSSFLHSVLSSPEHNIFYIQQ